MNDINKLASQSKKVFKSSKKKLETPLKHVLKLPRRLKDRIIKKSTSTWKYPFRKRMLDQDKENGSTSSLNKFKQETCENSESKEIKMAVIHTRHPYLGLNVQQADLIAENLKYALHNACQTYRDKLDIRGMEFDRGIFYVTCANHSTVNWMWETVHSLGDTQTGMLLRVIETRYLTIEQPKQTDIDYFSMTGLLRF